MSQPTNWTAALAILAVGIVAGIILIAAMRRKKGSAAAGPRRAALEKKKDALVRKIRSSQDPEERRKLQLEAADVLREIDRCDETTQPAAAVPATTRRPMMVGFALGVISTVVVGLLGYYGWKSATPRESGAAVSMASSAPAAPPDLEKWEKAVENDPENIDNRVALAKAYLSSQNLMGVYDQTAAVLKKNPDEPRALTYNAIVRMSMGQLDDARGMLEKAVGRDPRLLDGWVALASVRTQLKEHEAAAAAVEAAIAQYPGEEPRLRQLLAEMRSKPAEAAPPATEDPQSLPPDHPPIRSAAAAKDSLIRVNLALDPSIGAKGGIVYVIARAEGQKGGHPVAVKRVDSNAFPIEIELSSGDSMMGAPFPARVQLEARLDSDGDAGTAGPADPRAVASGVTPGSRVALTMK